MNSEWFLLYQEEGTNLKLNSNRTLLIEGKPIICGGGGDGSGTVNANPDCYIFDQSSWKFLVNLGTRRSQASSVVLWDELWVKFLMNCEQNVNISSTSQSSPNQPDRN